MIDREQEHAVGIVAPWLHDRAATLGSIPTSTEKPHVAGASRTGKPVTCARPPITKQAGG